MSLCVISLIFNTILSTQSLTTHGGSYSQLQRVKTYFRAGRHFPEGSARKPTGGQSTRSHMDSRLSLRFASRSLRAGYQPKRACTTEPRRPSRPPVSLVLSDRSVSREQDSPELQMSPKVPAHRRSVYCLIQNVPSSVRVVLHTIMAPSLPSSSRLCQVCRTRDNIRGSRKPRRSLAVFSVVNG